MSILNDYALYKLKDKNPFLTIEKGVMVKSPERIEIGPNTILQANTVLHGGGGEWCEFKGGISIGENSCISPNCTLYGTGAKIIIGKNFDCGPGVRIFASRTKYEHPSSLGNRTKFSFADVKIGDNVICYANVIISPGVTVGEGAVIGASSVVLNDIPPFTVNAGAPAKIIKKREFISNGQ